MATRKSQLNVRIVAATNKNLYNEISKGLFREDLYHRLSVILVHVPSLNERLDDIPELADAFLQDVTEEYNMKSKGFTKDAIAELQKLNWTGNIRELRNVVERLIILSGDKITGDDVKTYARPSTNHESMGALPINQFSTKEEWLDFASRMWEDHK